MAHKYALLYWRSKNDDGNVLTSVMADDSHEAVRKLDLPVFGELFDCILTGVGDQYDHCTSHPQLTSLLTRDEFEQLLEKLHFDRYETSEGFYYWIRRLQIIIHLMNKSHKQPELFLQAMYKSWLTDDETDSDCLHSFLLTKV